MLMSWHELLFIHYPLPAAAIREFIPPTLTIDEFDGSAWVGIVPFRMTGIRHRWLPPLPGCSAFPELNVRTYVRAADGRPGVWFFSLDAPHRLAVTVARKRFHLAYMDAAMTTRPRGDWIEYHARRPGPRTTFAFGAARSSTAELHLRYQPAGDVSHPSPATLEHFLTTRYCLYAFGNSRLWRGEIDHDPWPLRPARAIIERNTMLDQLGLNAGPAPLLHYAHRLDVVAWLPAAVG